MLSPQPFRFNKVIVEATAGLVSTYKLNSADYEASGPEGYAAMKGTIEMIHQVEPEAAVIIDAKRGDTHDTNIDYACALFDEMQADEIEKLLGHATHYNGVPLYEYVAYKVAHSWNKNHNCGLVIGATRSDELREIRKVIGDNMPILSPGIGAQGGDTYQAFSAGKNKRGEGLILSSSRSIIFASTDNVAEAAHRETKKIAEEIHRARLKHSCRLSEGQASPL